MYEDGPYLWHTDVCRESPVPMQLVLYLNFEMSNEFGAAAC